MAPPAVKPVGPASNGPVPEVSNPVGPPSGLSSIPTQYTSEQTLRQMLKSIGYDEAREDGYRLKGIQLINTVRQSLHLYVCLRRETHRLSRAMFTHFAPSPGRSRRSIRLPYTTTSFAYDSRVTSIITKTSLWRLCSSRARPKTLSRSPKRYSVRHTTSGNLMTAKCLTTRWVFFLQNSTEPGSRAQADCCSRYSRACLGSRLGWSAIFSKPLDSTFESSTLRSSLSRWCGRCSHEKVA